MKHGRLAKVWGVLTAPLLTRALAAFDRAMNPVGKAIAAILLIALLAIVLDPWLAALLWIGAGG